MLAELSSCSTFKVVCCIRRSQVSETTGVDWLYTVNQILRCSAEMDHIYGRSYDAMLWVHKALSLREVLYK